MSNSVKVVIKRVLYCLPLALIFLFFYSQLVNLERNEILKQVQKEHQIHLNYIETVTNREFSILYRVMEFLKTNSWVDSYIEAPQKHEKEMENLFEGVLQNQRKIQYIGFFSANGDMELLGVQEGRSTEDFSLSAYNLTLQDLIDEVSTVEEHEIYIHSVAFIKNPVTNTNEQMILIASPVMQGEKVIGALVFSIELYNIFSILDTFIHNHSQVFTFKIIEGNGNELINATRFNSLNYETHIVDFSHKHPTVWDAIQREGTGSVEVDSIVYQFITINPFKGFSPYYNTYGHYFVAISSFPLSELELIQSSFLLRNEPLRYIIALLILFGSVIISLLVSYRKNDQELIALSNIISDQSHDGVLIRKPTREVTYINRAVELLTGFSEEEILVNSLSIELLSESSFDQMIKKQSKRKAKQMVSYDDFVWIHSKNSYILSHMLMNSVFNNHQKLLYFVQLLSDPQNLSRESFDNLVLQNRTETVSIDTFPIRMIEQLANQHQLYAIMYIKLTNLDIIEAQFTLAQHYQLGSMIRGNLISILKKDEHIFQYSPDTYLITITGNSDTLDEKILLLSNLFASPFGISHNKKVLTYQCGIAIYQKSQKIASLITESRMALATLLHFNQHGVLLYDRSINDSLLRYYSILKKIPLAFENGEIEIYFQPFVGTASKAILGAEALVRWNDKELGIIPPLEFIPIIENHDLEQMLDFYVMEKAAQCISSMSEIIHDDFFISVNLCPPILFIEQFIPHLVQTLKKYHIEHKRIVLELTERTLLKDLHRANSILAELHNLGFNIAIDDFGTGFSSLSYLDMLDIDIVKIDRSFIKDYPQKSEGKIIKAILTMAQELDIHTFVEGIETQEQLSFVTEQHANAYQGFLFSKAITLDELKNLYTNYEIRIMKKDQ